MDHPNPLIPASTSPAQRRRRSLLTAWTLLLTGLVASAMTTLATRLREDRYDESGNVITDNLGWIVFGVLAIVAIGALIKTLGASVINWVSSQLGL
jgi:hypothetical protein